MTAISTTSRTRCILGLAGVAVVMIAAGSGAVAKAAPSGADSRQIRFATTVFATESNENVDMVGRLHVVTLLSGSERDGWTIDWHANPDDTSGTGETTGDEYRGTGADHGTVAMPPGPPVRTAIFEPSFTVLPPGPPTHPPSPCRLAVTVSYDETGRVSDVQVRAADAPTGTVD